MEIKPAAQVLAAHYELLLDADPSREMVDRYLKKGTLFEAKVRSQIVGVLALVPTSKDAVEIMNLAVDEKYRGQGIAQEMLQFAIEQAQVNGYQRIEIGTGSTSFQQLYLYQKCGFRLTHIDQDFFVRYYSEPIVENGLVLKDMVRLALEF